MGEEAGEEVEGLENRNVVLRGREGTVLCWCTFFWDGGGTSDVEVAYG